MSRRLRLWLLVAGVAGVGTCLGIAVLQMPHMGSAYHPYRTRAVHAAVEHHTANAVSSVIFDQRAMDTLGEETILLGSVVGVAALLRPSKEEREGAAASTGRVPPLLRLIGYATLPTVGIVGVDLVAHGHVTPGGGFQGGVVLATGLHLLYVSGSYQALQSVRPLRAFEVAEAVGAAAFACLGIAGVITAASFLADVLPNSSFGQLFSAGTVPLLNGAVGLEVASGVIVLLAKFLDQALLVGRRRSP